MYSETEKYNLRFLYKKTGFGSLNVSPEHYKIIQNMEETGLIVLINMTVY